MSVDSLNLSDNEGDDIPYSNTILVLGILSIPTCFCYGITGIVIALIVFYLHKKAIKFYNSNPSKYKKVSFKNIKTGKICATVGIILAFIYILFVALLFISGSSSIYNNFTIF